MDKNVKKQIPYLKKILNYEESKAVCSDPDLSMEDIIVQLAEIDPSENKCNLHIFCWWMAEETLIWTEDRNKLKSLMEAYVIAKAKYPQLTAISKFKCPQDLSKLLEKLLYPERIKENKKAVKIKDLLDLKGVKALYFEKADAILEVDDATTMSKLSSGTKWCTSDPYTAHGYLEDGPFHLLMSKGKKHSLWHLPSAQAMDIYDKPLFENNYYLINMKPLIITNSIMDKMLDLFKDSIHISLLLKKRNQKMEPIWIETEPVNNLYFYARDIIKGRWVEAEDKIKTNSDFEQWYRRDVIRNNASNMYNEYI